MTKKEKVKKILEELHKKFGEPKCALNFETPFELLVAVILSAQCTDKRINAITPELFRHYPDAKTMAKASVEDVFEYVKSVSYPNSKATHLVDMSRMLVEKFNGEVPSTPDELTQLPGVGRKTANVIQAVWFGKPTLAVDTHVYRVSHRLGLVPSTANTPRKVEDYLMKNIPTEEVSDAHHWILLHGRYVCKSAKADCEHCPFDEICPKLMKDSKL